MSDTKDDGGTAFPVLDNAGGGLSCREFGMTLRDYFAANSVEHAERWE